MRLQRKNKYHNRKVTVDNVKFDSVKESKRYNELRLLLRAGKIKDLKLQPEFILQLGFEDSMGTKHRPIIYRADFQYKEDGQTIIEDCKGMRTEVYKIKKKLFLYGYQDYIFIES